MSVLSDPKAKKMVRLSLAVALLMPMADLAHAQAVVCTRSLVYGSFAETGGGGSIRVTPLKNNVFSSGAIALLGTPLAARCIVKSFTGFKTATVKVSAKTTKIKGAGSMSVKSFNIATAAGGPTKLYNLTSITKTAISFGVGANLRVNTAQAIGAYSGTLMVIVTFTP